MKWVFISDVGDLLPIAKEFQDEGQEVMVIYYKNKACWKQKVYQNIVPIYPILPPLSKFKKNETIFVFETALQDKLAGELQKQGYLVLGCAENMSKFEIKRFQTIELVRKLSIPVPKTIYIHSPQALSLIIEHFKNQKCVIKEEASRMTENTIICETGEEAYEVAREKTSEGILTYPFIVQQFIEGVEISTEAWFSHGRFVPPLNSTFEDKKFLAGDLGCNTGCMSSVVFNWKDTFTCRPYRQIFQHFIPVMRNFDYTGPVDFNCIVSKTDRKAYFLEITPRFGYNAIFAWKHLLKNESLLNVFFRLLSGNLQELPVYYDKFSFALRLTTFPYPGHVMQLDEKNNLKNVVEGLPVIYPEQLLKNNLYLLDVRKTKKGEIEMAGYDGILGELVEIGDTIEEAISKVMAYTKLIKVVNLQYRIDAGQSAINRYNTLKEWQWI